MLDDRGLVVVYVSFKGLEMVGLEGENESRLACERKGGGVVVVMLDMIEGVTMVTEEVEVDSNLGVGILAVTK